MMAKLLSLYLFVIYCFFYSSAKTRRHLYDFQDLTSELKVWLDNITPLALSNPVDNLMLDLNTTLHLAHDYKQIPEGDDEDMNRLSELAAISLSIIRVTLDLDDLAKWFEEELVEEEKQQPMAPDLRNSDKLLRITRPQIYDFGLGK